MSFTIRFTDDHATELAAVGGKAASLGRLVAAGFPVPPGFTVSTQAYREFIRANELDPVIEKLMAEIDYADATLVERQTDKIRAEILACPIPARLQEEIVAAYEALGTDAYVAVRSSGTAEDLAEASFAGMHDTYLDVRGTEFVVDAVRRCWSSMWTARATAYRQNSAFSHNDALVAVVVQVMVASDVAGVMFSGNPLTARADEIVLNASYGLGEAVVSGLVTPDELVLDLHSLRVKRRIIGTKEVSIVRDTSAGSGTVKEEVPGARQRECALSDEQAAALGDLGRRVTAYYGGLPQDIEWAVAGEELFLLQSRPVTGVEFTWDEDVDAWQAGPEDDETTWTNTWAAEYWTGAITPLFYSVRAREFTNIFDRLAATYGFDQMKGMRHYRFRRATCYYNTKTDALWYQQVLPPSMRAAVLGNMPAAEREAAAAAPLDLKQFVRFQVGLNILAPEKRLLRWFDAVYDYINHRVDEANGPSDEEFRGMSDEALRDELTASVQLADDFIGELWTGFFVYAAQAMSVLGTMLANWYDGTNAFVFQELISGLPERTAMAEETHAMWSLTEQIRQSKALTKLFEKHTDGQFFAACENSEEGRAFLDRYQEFMQKFGHRGHADRDIYYPRRSEDPSLDYQAFKLMLSADGGMTPEESERKLIAQREEATADVLDRIARRPFGSLKAEAFKAVLAYTHRFLILRDNERAYIDRVTLRKKRGFAELGRRLVERGLLETERDHYFLAEQELYAVLEGRAPAPLIKAKVAARMRVFDAFLAREENPPRYLKGDMPVDLDNPAGSGEDGTLQGLGTSRGTITGRARVVPSLKDIGRVEPGDILVCNSTDPGWAPVFLIISGVVVETGGMLAHASCLSREYGLPAVQLPDAMRLIVDGATITVSGDNGQIRIVDEEVDERAA